MLYFFKKVCYNTNELIISIRLIGVSILETFTSKALEANLKHTRVKEIEIPEEQQWFIEVSRAKWGIHKRAGGICHRAEP